jgi:hypothetical protein
VSIDLTPFKPPIKLDIMDLHGKAIQSILCPESELIDVNFEEPAGVYLLNIESVNNKFVTILIKN